MAVTTSTTATIPEAAVAPEPDTGPALVGAFLHTVLLALAAGGVVGVVTAETQRFLTWPWAALANAVSPWLAPAFAVGALTRRTALAAPVGALVCLGELAGYYATDLEHGVPVAMSVAVFWACCGVVGGPLFAVGGRLWRSAVGGRLWRHARAWTRGLGPALLAGVFLAEAFGYLTAARYHTSAAVLFGLIGVGLLVVLGYHRRQHAHAVLWLLVVLPFGLFGEVLLNAASYVVV